LENSAGNGDALCRPTTVVGKIAQSINELRNPYSNDEKVTDKQDQAGRVGIIQY